MFYGFSDADYLGIASGQRICSIIKPFKDATNIICGEYYLTASLKNKLQTFESSTDIGHHFKKALKD